MNSLQKESPAGLPPYNKESEKISAESRAYYGDTAAIVFAKKSSIG